MSDQLDLTQLRAVAEAATPGPWEAVEETSTWMLKPGDDPLTDCDPCSQGESPIKVETYESWTTNNGYVFDATINHTHRAEAHQVTPVTGNYDYEEGGILEERDVQFIATFDPPTVLALLSRLEQAEQLARINNQAMLEQTQRAGRAEQQVARVRAMAEEMGEAIGFDRLVHGSEAEYPVSYFRDKLEEALDGEQDG